MSNAGDPYPLVRSPWGAPGPRPVTARPDAPELSAAERQRVDRIEAAPAAAESFDAVAALRRVDALHHDLMGWCAGCDYTWPCETNRALAMVRGETS